MPAWGGARPGAGRKKRGLIASERHEKRPALTARIPLRIVARMAPSLAAVPRGRLYTAIRRAAERSLARTNFRIVHLALRRQRLELVVEADDRIALARGMQGFQVSAARALNRARARRGTVFPDRYRATALRTRAMVRALVHRTLRHVGVDDAIVLAPVRATFPLLDAAMLRPP